jgi:hypothetical protein
MKNHIKKFGAAIFVLLLVLGGTFFTSAKPVHAQYAVFDAIGDVFHAIEAAADTASNYIQTEMQIQNSVLKDIAIGIAKQMLQQLTLSVVNWINSGFSGGPAFVTNPAQYFENLGDDIAGNFLQQNGNLKFLCSPFSLDVRIALALKIQANNAQQYTCTLSSAIANATNAAQNASITGFVQGDFSQGGWPAFIALTTQPQNNAGGAFLQAESDLTKKINTQITQKTNELAQGLGFMSKQTCTYTSTDGGGNVTTVTADQYKTLQSNNTDEEGDQIDTLAENCTTQTPGSVISSILDKHLGVPTDELLLAQDLNAIISAAFSQLVLQVFNGGLASISSSGGASGSNYLDQLTSQSNAQLQALQASSIQQLTPYLNNALAYKNNIDTALATVMGTKANIDAAIACWAPYASSNPTAQGQIAQLQTTEATQIAPLAATIGTEDASASSSVQSIVSVENNVNSAQNATDLNNSSLQVSELTTGQGLIQSSDIQTAQDQITTVNDTVGPINAGAQNSLQQCRAFVAANTPSSSSAGTGN